MNRFSEMGFTKDSWKGQRGEYWVLAQMALLAVFAGGAEVRPGKY